VYKLNRTCGSALAIGSVLASGLVLPAPATAQTVADRALSDIKAETAGGCSTLAITFNIRVQIVSWFPETSGRELHVRLLPLDGANPTQLRDSLRTPTSVPALRSVQYEGDNPSGPILSLFFTRDMAFTVEAGTTPQQVMIRVSDPKAAACAPSAAPLAAAPTPMVAPGSAADQAETARLIGEAEQAIRAGEVDRAVQLLTNAAALPETADTPRALELLGLARERKGQAAQARAQYEEYLARFPQGEAADRVRQRLAALTPTPGAPQQLHAASGSAGKGTEWTFGVRGSFSQFYFRDQGRTSTFTTSSTLGTEVDNSVNVNQLLTAGDITLSAGNDRRQFQLRAAGSYTKNFGTSASVSTINNGNQTLTFRSQPGGGIKALTALYLDYADSELDTSLRVGRQTRNSAGVLGRFDGALLGFQANPHLRFNVVGGFPVLSSHQMSVLKERPFYGLSVDFGTKRSPLQLSAYWFDQRARGGFIDRRSIGAEARFLKKRFNAYAMIDYDVKFGALNLGLVSLNYNFPDSSSLSLTADYRQSPLLTTTNALIGQFDLTTNLPILTLHGLRPFFTDPQIYQLARDRTLVAKSVTVTYSRPLTRKLQVSADFNMTDTGGTPATPATANTMAIGALPATGKEYYYGLQLIGSGLLWSNDIYILAGRYSNTAMARVWTADFNARVPITGKFRLSPRLRYGYRDNKITAATPVPGTYRQFQPTLRMNYYPVRHSEIEIEFGGNFTSQSQYNGASWDRIREQGWVLSAGYRLDF